MAREFKVVTLINAATVDKTSDSLDIAGARKVTLLFRRGTHTSGNTVFSVTASMDDITYITANILIDNVTNTNAQTLTRVASSTLSTATEKMYALDLTSFGFRYIKAVTDVTTDGANTVKALVEY